MTTQFGIVCTAEAEVSHAETDITDAADAAEKED